MAVKPLRCPHCGAVIETFDETMKKGFCPFCDTLIEDVQQRQTEATAMHIAYAVQSKSKPEKRFRGIFRFAFACLISALSIVFMFAMWQNNYGPYSFREILQFQCIPYVALLIGGLGLFIWSIVGFFVDLQLSKRGPVSKNLSLAALCLSIAILAVIPILGVYSNYRYEATSPKGQLIQAGINKDEIETVLADLEKFGLYDPSKESTYVRGWSFEVQPSQEANLFYLTAEDFMLKYDYPRSNDYYIRVINGRITEIQGVNTGIYIVENGALTDNSLGKRHLIYEYQSKSYELWSMEVIKDQLKSPSTAKCIWNTSSRSNDKNGTITIFGTVDAENSFGAMMREEFSITMTAYTDEEIRELDTEEYIICRMSLSFPLSD